MKIYCNGDSFTAGVGLADYIFPEFKRNYSELEFHDTIKERTEFQNHKSQYEQKFVDLNTFMIDPTLVEFRDQPDTDGYVNLAGSMGGHEKNHSYTRSLEKLNPSITTINKAIPGAGIVGICQRTILDLLELKNKNVHIDRVIIQLTSLERCEIYDLSQPWLLYERVVNSFNVKKDNDISLAMFNKYTISDWVIKYLFNLITLKECVVSITGKPPLFIDSANVYHIWSIIRESKNKITNNYTYNLETFNSLIEHSMINECRIIMKDIAKNIPIPYTSCGHYTQAVHEKTAEEILKAL